MLDTETLAAKINRRNELDAEIADLKEQIESAKTPSSSCHQGYRNS